MNQSWMLAVGLTVEVAHHASHPCSHIIANAMLAIRISISLPSLASKNEDYKPHSVKTICSGARYLI
ncbi:hypothetical protein VNO77_14159 [Canavalia gladiata]|uniref:Uncharacterized protein n=1 Tax=Canavalia gladiata TaxID=3824 RepID=A0AAN9QNL3_CANGL